MNGEDAVAAVIDAFNMMGIPYMLTGSLASNFYGVPRATQDADFVIQLTGHSVSALSGQLGPAFRIDAQLGFETITGTTRYIIQVVNSTLVIELFLLTDDPHDQQRFSRRRPITMLGRNAFLPTPEDVIITKLRWSHQGKRLKDVEDVRNVIAINRERIDWDYVRGWCRQHETNHLLDDLLGQPPTAGGESA